MRIVDLPAANSIRFGRLYYKPRDLERIASESVRLVVLEEVGIEYLGRSGSATLVRLREQKFILLTRHQLNLPTGPSLEQRALEALRISTTDGENLTNIPTDQAIFETGNTDEEYHDVIALRVAFDPTLRTRDDVHFIDISDELTSPPRHTFAVGYPMDDNLTTYDPPHIILRKAWVNCKLDPDYQSNAEFIRHYTYENVEGRNVDGFSGGAIFGLRGDTGSFRLDLDALILRGGNGHLYAVQRQFLRRLVEAFS